MPYVTLGVMGASALYKAIDAQSRKKKAERGLKELAKFQPRYKTLEESEAAIRTGYSPEEKAAFQAQSARAKQAAYTRATQTNPNLAGAIQAGINYGDISAQQDFAARDAALRRQRQQQWLGRQDIQTGEDLRSKQMREQQFGLAYQQAAADTANALNQLGYGIATMYSGTGGKGIFPKKKRELGGGKITMPGESSSISGSAPSGSDFSSPTSWYESGQEFAVEPSSYNPMGK